MRVWRISRSVYPVLDGEGARRWGGRWNSAGTAVVYAAESRALAMLESRVGVRLPEQVPDDLALFEIDVPDECAREALALEALPPDWHRIGNPWCRKVGDEWAESLRTLVLAVPSVLVPEEHNYLLNPRHPDARQIRVMRSRPFEFDPRLLH